MPASIAAPFRLRKPAVLRPPDASSHSDPTALVPVPPPHPPSRHTPLPIRLSPHAAVLAASRSPEPPLSPRPDLRPARAASARASLGNLGGSAERGAEIADEADDDEDLTFLPLDSFAFADLALTPGLDRVPLAVAPVSRVLCPAQASEASALDQPEPQPSALRLRSSPHGTAERAFPTPPRGGSSVLALSRRPGPDGAAQWHSCEVRAHDPREGLFEIRWVDEPERPGDTPQPGKWVSRLNLRMPFEELASWYAALATARELRRAAEQHSRVRVAARDLPLDAFTPMPEAWRQRIDALGVLRAGLRVPECLARLRAEAAQEFVQAQRMQLAEERMRDAGVIGKLAPRTVASARRDGS
ncbi:hypothetical protein T492DRAFT_1018021 [Pavlovales sp. CCMP2436]|nr:hypothetical protein T492DRAFT_1018021 [Pavlovales sp. CCMP2436]